MHTYYRKNGNRYKLTFTCQYEKTGYHIYIFSYEWKCERLLLSARTRKEALSETANWFRILIEEGKEKEFMEKGYPIEVDLPPLLKDLKSHRAVYHLADRRHHTSIIQNGLIPQGTPRASVDQASHYLDQIRPLWVPTDVVRSKALYLYPTFVPEEFLLERKDTSLYATILPLSENDWMGSQSIAGMTLFDEEFNEEEKKAHIREILTEYGPDYWANSCSVSDYLLYGSRVRKKDRQTGGLDEILHFNSIQPSAIDYLGYWDEEGIFKQTSNFQRWLLVK